MINNRMISSASVVAKVMADLDLKEDKNRINDIREWIRTQKDNEDKNSSTIDWNDVVFEVDLLKSQEINLDYRNLCTNRYTKVR